MRHIILLLATGSCRSRADSIDLLNESEDFDSAMAEFQASEPDEYRFDNRSDVFIWNRIRMQIQTIDKLSGTVLAVDPGDWGVRN